MGSAESLPASPSLGHQEEAACDETVFLEPLPLEREVQEKSGWPCLRPGVVCCKETYDPWWDYAHDIMGESTGEFTGEFGPRTCGYEAENFGTWYCPRCTGVGDLSTPLVSNAIQVGDRVVTTLGDRGQVVSLDFAGDPTIRLDDDSTIHCFIRRCKKIEVVPVIFEPFSDCTLFEELPDGGAKINVPGLGTKVAEAGEWSLVCGKRVNGDTCFLTQGHDGPCKKAQAALKIKERNDASVSAKGCAANEGQKTKPPPRSVLSLRKFFERKFLPTITAWLAKNKEDTGTSRMDPNKSWQAFICDKTRRDLQLALKVEFCDVAKELDDLLAEYTEQPVWPARVGDCKVMATDLTKGTRLRFCSDAAEVADKHVYKVLKVGKDSVILDQAPSQEGVFSVYDRSGKKLYRREAASYVLGGRAAAYVSGIPVYSDRAYNSSEEEKRKRWEWRGENRTMVRVRQMIDEMVHQLEKDAVQHLVNLTVDDRVVSLEQASIALHQRFNALQGPTGLQPILQAAVAADNTTAEPFVPFTGAPRRVGDSAPDKELTPMKPGAGSAGVSAAELRAEEAALVKLLALPGEERRAQLREDWTPIFRGPTKPKADVERGIDMVLFAFGARETDAVVCDLDEYRSESNSVLKRDKRNLWTGGRLYDKVATLRRDRENAERDAQVSTINRRLRAFDCLLSPDEQAKVRKRESELLALERFTGKRCKLGD